jgi:hypothetical protein
MGIDNQSQQLGLQGQKASLGCGTLILIALIVLIFSSRGADELRSDIRDLRNEIAVLKKAIDEQTKQITALQDQPSQ